MKSATFYIVGKKAVWSATFTVAPSGRDGKGGDEGAGLPPRQTVAKRTPEQPDKPPKKGKFCTRF